MTIRRSAPKSASDGALHTREGGAEIPLGAVKEAMAHGSPIHVAASVQCYARQSRANGDTVHEVVKRLLDLFRGAAADHAISSKESSDIATWAIDGYFDQAEPPVPYQEWRKSDEA